MNRFVHMVQNNTFVRNVAVLATGTALGQALIVVASPILSRLYDPTAFGTLAVIIAISSPLTQIGTLQYTSAIVLARRLEDAVNLAILSAGLAISTALIATAVLFAAGDWIAEAFGDSATAPLLRSTQPRKQQGHPG